MNQTQEHQQKQELQKELEQLEKQIQALKEQQKQGIQDVEAQKQLKEDLKKVIEKLDVKTEEHGAVFYDNEARWIYDAETNQVHSININQERANKFCREPENSHCKTLGDTDGGRWLNNQKIYECFSSEVTTELWNQISDKYAREASGETHAFVRFDSAQHRTWETAEKPALQKNPNVTYINYHYHPTPNQEVIKRENLARPESHKIQFMIDGKPREFTFNSSLSPQVIDKLKNDSVFREQFVQKHIDQQQSQQQQIQPVQQDQTTKRQL